MRQIRLTTLLLLAAYAFAIRLIPYALHLAGVSIDPETTWYPWNFSPFMAVCLFAGAASLGRFWTTALPFAVLLASDLGVWALTGRMDWAFYPGQPLIYGCFALSLLMSRWTLGPNPGWNRALPTAFAAEVAFFLITNWAVWAFEPSVTYPRTPAGLWMCYVAALPFFGRSLLSTMLFTMVLFSPIGLRQTNTPPRVLPAKGRELAPVTVSTK